MPQNGLAYDHIAFTTKVISRLLATGRALE